MQPKPEHLNNQNAAAFDDPAVAAAYRHRATYPPQTIDILRDLITPASPRVLDAGAGTGDIARPLSAHIVVDAVEPSAAMIAVGQTLSGGDRPSLRWLHSTMETATLEPHYGLVVAGQSLHWMDWQVVMPLFRRVLRPGGFVAVVDVESASRDAWSDHDQVGALIRQYSVVQNYAAYDIVTELEQRGLFRRVETRRTEPYPYTPTVDQYIESFHARSSLARARLGTTKAAAFDAAMREVLTPHAINGRLVSSVRGVVEWGEPLDEG